MKDYFFNWLVDTMARTDMIDLYFVVSDLIDIPRSDLEIAEAASYDALCRQMVESMPGKKQKPLGKLVF